jgi:hypothetical protein
VIESVEIEPPGLFTATVEKSTPQASSIGVSIDPQAPEGPLSAVLRIKTNRPGETDLRARLLAVTKK